MALRVLTAEKPRAGAGDGTPNRLGEEEWRV
jgi:hypothetical protein